MIKSVSNKSLTGKRDSAGVGFVIIPSNVDKDKYIEYCFRSSTVSIMLENGGVLDNVLITNNALNEIEFPDSFDTKGTQLIWINQPRKNQPIAIGSISHTNEFVNFNKNKSALRRATKNFVSEISVDAQKGTVIITSNSSVEGGGDIYILSTNKNKTSKCVINISGDLNITSTNLNIINTKKFSLTIKDELKDDLQTNITYEKGSGLKYVDEFENEVYLNADNIQLKPKKRFNIGEGKESLMLTDTFKVIFEDFTDILNTMALEIAKLQVSTINIPSTVPLNTAKFIEISSDLQKIKSKYKNFQSKISFTD